MKRVTITITLDRTMPGTNYLWSISGPGARTQSRMSAGCDPGAAAAKAMELAIGFGENGYAIFAPDEIMKRIPEDMRTFGI